MLRPAASHGNGGHGPAADENSIMKILGLPVWGVFGELSLLTLKDIPYSQPLMFLYVLISTVVLVNLLVAMFADTYTRIQSSAEKEYRLQKTARTYLYRNVVLAMPPPLNFPYVFCALMFTGVVERAAAEAAYADACDDDMAVSEGRSRLYMEAFLKRMADEESSTMEAMVQRIREDDLRLLAETTRKLHGAMEGVATNAEREGKKLAQQLQALAAKVDNVVNLVHGVHADGAARAAD